MKKYTIVDLHELLIQVGFIGDDNCYYKHKLKSYFIRIYRTNYSLHGYEYSLRYLFSSDLILETIHVDEMISEIKGLFKKEIRKNKYKQLYG